MKLALLRFWERARTTRAAIVLQLHDELLVEVPEEEVDYFEKMLKTAMEGAFNFVVPLVVSMYFSFVYLSKTNSFVFNSLFFFFFKWDY